MRLACWLLALFALPLGAQQIPAAARRADLSYVATQVPQLDPNFYSQLDPAAYQQAVAALQSQISTLPDARFYVQLAALIALAGDAHTNIALNGSAAAVAGFLQFPLQFQWLDDGVFVTSAAATYEQALGAR